MRPRQWLYLSAFTVYLVSTFVLVRLEHGGPPHTEVELPNGAPATLYLPNAGNPFFSINPIAAAERAPVAVLAHGYSEDRATMSSLARRLALNGYAVVAIDARGHGENQRPFDPDGVSDDIRSAVEFARASAFVDGSKVVVIGHSMGAGAAMRYAMSDPRLAGSVMIAGLWPLDGPAPPRNPLFLFGQFDPPPLRVALKALTAQLAKTGNPEMGETYGDFQNGTAVRAIEVPGQDHMSLPASSGAAEAIVHWLDATTLREPGKTVVVRDPRRIVTLVSLLASLVLLAGIGELAGHLAPACEQRPPGPGWSYVLALVGWLLVAMPVVADSAPAAFLGLDDGNILVSWLAIGGLLICGFLMMRGQLPVPAHIGRSLLAAVAAFVAIYVMYVPLGAVVHRLSLTPHRAIAMIVGAVLLTPFFLGFEALLRRGDTRRSTSYALAGRFAVVILLFLGGAASMLSVAFVFFAWIVLVIFLVLEVFASAVYATSGNVLTIAIAEALSLAWLLAATMPIRF